MTRVRLRSWVRETIVPFLEEELAKTEPQARILVNDRVIFLRYPSLTTKFSYVKQEVKLEFSPCVSTEYSKRMPVKCDLAGCIESLILPKADSQTMNAERTFWKKSRQCMLSVNKSA